MGIEVSEPFPHQLFDADDGHFAERHRLVDAFSVLFYAVELLTILRHFAVDKPTQRTGALQVFAVGEIFLCHGMQLAQVELAVQRLGEQSGDERSARIFLLVPYEGAQRLQCRVVEGFPAV